jgi:hypothetical protein
MIRCGIMWIRGVAHGKLLPASTSVTLSPCPSATIRPAPGPRTLPVALNRATAARMFGLDGRVAIVTGSSSGLGATVAETLASPGARVAVVARRKDRLEEPAERIGDVAVACDLSDLDQVGTVVPAVLELLGPRRFWSWRRQHVHREARRERIARRNARTMDLSLLAPSGSRRIPSKLGLSGLTSQLAV